MQCFVSAKYTGWLLKEVPCISDSTDNANDKPTVCANPKFQFQEIEGFGGAFTEAAARTWQKLSATVQRQVLRAYFDRSTGHGYSLCRVHMNSCDFALGNYAHAEMPEDLGLEHFSIERDQQALLPFIKAAQREAGAALKLLASPLLCPSKFREHHAPASQFHLEHL